MNVRNHQPPSSGSSNPALSQCFQHVHPLMRLDFSERTPKTSESLAPLAGVPSSAQESAVINELFSVLQGYSGSYIYALPLDGPNSIRKFLWDKSMDSFLQYYIAELLPCASLYSCLARFVDNGMDLEHGMVIHALVCSVRQFLKDFRQFLADLEDEHLDGQLTIHRFHLRMGPVVLAFETLSEIVISITTGSLRGGSVLSVLYEKLLGFVASEEIKQLLLRVTKSVAVPFLTMLSRWINEGTLDDPHLEFMIVTGKQKRNKDVHTQIHDPVFWSHRYKIVPGMVPKFLEPYTDKVLRCGKYLNILRQCGFQVAQESPKIEFHMDPRHFEMEVAKAYMYVSGKLLNLMMDSEHLVAKLRSIRHFFLLDQDDFIAEFLRFALDQLEQPVAKVNKSAILSSFDDAVRSSALNADPHKSMMRPVFLKNDIMRAHRLSNTADLGSSSSSLNGISTLSAMDAFTMDCDVRFPFCLLINEEVKECYQMLFMMLFKLKVSEWNLGRIWINCASCESNSMKRYCYPLVHQMLDFVKGLQHYFSGEVVAPLWHDMMLKIRKANTFDEVLHEHDEFIDSCSNDCFLGHRETLTLVYKVLNCCAKNCRILMDPRFFASSIATSSVDRMKENFSEHMIDLLENMSDARQSRESQHKLVGALHRLDCNEYYTAQLLERSREKARSRSDSNVVP